MNIAKIIAISGITIIAFAFAFIITKDKTTIEKAVILLLPVMGIIIGFMLDDEIGKKEK